MVSVRQNRRARGFTLFEVLAAAMVLALVGAASFFSMSSDLHRMGQSRRRLEAGMIADTVLADLEATLVGGGVPDPQDETTEIRGYRVKTVVGPFSYMAAAEEEDTNPAPGDPDDAPPSLTQLIRSEFPGLPQRIKVLVISVTWADGAGEQTVQRATIAFDHEGALEAIAERADMARDLAGDSNRPGGDGDEQP